MVKDDEKAVRTMDEYLSDVHQNACRTNLGRDDHDYLTKGKDLLYVLEEHFRNSF